MCPSCRKLLRVYADYTLRSANEVLASAPKQLLTLLEEAITTYDARAFTATLLTCRRIIETICQWGNIRGRSLAEKIESLRGIQLFRGRDDIFLFDTTIRTAGNLAAHADIIRHPDKMAKQNDAVNVLSAASMVLIELFGGEVIWHGPELPWCGYTPTPDEDAV
jgi:hypothetical protein